ncbi:MULTISPECIES: DEAD/DEAH box helicase [unclassified Blastococcus]|uniref:DEAD/DEAH box helicase n=1 Tax=unclassified Blastococcus TaxID=2619396 RepID=UPI001EEFCFB7|nr:MULTISPECIES: DEAD/DEAH box helicase [unclassified Blastococcus]
MQRWIYDNHWTGLRDAQERAVPLLIQPSGDVLISAATAGGKTEAAFLPIISNLLDDPAPGPGLQALYVAPLKALINDQYARLTDLCDGTDVPVHRWHGDVAADRKTKLLKAPSGILLTTPESLEALFVLRGTKVAALFAQLRYVVIDELHAFLGTERGAQLRSLLHRLELTVRRRVARVGLSATLGDMQLAAAQLRPAAPDQVSLIESASGGQDLRLAIRGYLDSAPRPAGPTPTSAVGDAEEDVGEDATLTSTRLIRAHLFDVLRGTDNLVFANSRSRVEMYADQLRQLCEQAHLSNEFFPHHGSLSKELREDVEAALKDPARPVTAVATTTLEMGIDIGSVASIAQVGPPPSVAGLRQRLGRSGRRGEPAILRTYITEPEIDPRTPLADQLRGSLAQTIATIELLLDGWCEPPDAAVLHTSTLVQQLLSLIAQHGGVTPQDAYRALCDADGPFSATTPFRFKALLRSLADREVIDQSRDGTLLLAEVGERTVNHYSFYAAFTSPEEYRLLHGGRQLGVLPIDFPLYIGLGLIFGGRRWRVTGINDRQRTIDLTRAAGGRPPTFAGDGAAVHDRIRAHMRDLLANDRVPAFLNATARQFLVEARDTFHRHELAHRSLLPRGSATILVPWVGTRTANTLTVLLRHHGVEATNDGLTITCERDDPTQVITVLASLASTGPEDPRALAASVHGKQANKYDMWLDDALLDEDYAAQSLDTTSAHQTVLRLLTEANADRP